MQLAVAISPAATSWFDGILDSIFGRKKHALQVPKSYGNAVHEWKMVDELDGVTLQAMRTHKSARYGGPISLINDWLEPGKEQVGKGRVDLGRTWLRVHNEVDKVTCVGERSYWTGIVSFEVLCIQLTLTASSGPFFPHTLTSGVVARNTVYAQCWGLRRTTNQFWPCTSIPEKEFGES